MARQPSPVRPTASGLSNPESRRVSSADQPGEATGQAALEAHAAGLAEAYEITVEQARDCLARLVDTFCPELLDCPAELTVALRRFPLNLLSGALATMSATRAVGMIRTSDLADLARRVQVTDRLFAEATPLYTVSELAEQLNRFIAFLRRHRDSIIRTGLTPEPFGPSPWLNAKLGRLYDTRTTSSPWPPYQWVQTPGDEYYGGDLRICDYDRADFLNGLDPSYALRVEGGRENLFELKVRVLDCVGAALRRQQADDLWPACLSLLTAALTKEEVELCLYMDRFCLGCDFTQHEGDDDPAMVPGGLTNWLELVGHVEEEVTLGAMSAARSHLDDKAVDRLNELLDDITPDRLYFAVFGRVQQQGLDAALDALTARRAEVEAFWQGFRERAENAFEAAFRVELPIRIRSAHADLAGPLLQRYADHVQIQLDKGEWFDRPPRGMSIFRRDGTTWTICFDGKLVGKPDSVGLLYLRLLLEQPGKALSVSALRRVRPLWEADPGRPLRFYIDQIFDAVAGEDNAFGQPPSDLGDAVDAEAMQSYQTRITELDQLILQAREAGDPEPLAVLQREQQELHNHIKQAQRIGGKRRKMSPQGKKDNDAVCKALKEAIADLEKSHPAFARHLDKHLTVEAMCRYDPDPPVAWEF